MEKVAREKQAAHRSKEEDRWCMTQQPTNNWAGISKSCKEDATNSKNKEEEQQRAMQQPTNNKVGNGKGSKGEVSGAQKQREGAVACDATTIKNYCSR